MPKTTYTTAFQALYNTFTEEQEKLWKLHLKGKLVREVTVDKLLSLSEIENVYVRKRSKE